MAQKIDGADILIITVNSHETKAIDEALKTVGAEVTPCQGKKHREPYDDYGYINKQRIVHVTAMMGSNQSGGSRETVIKAIEDLSPSLILAVGIAWGAREDENQSIGDILLSQQVQMGSPAKLLESHVIYRGARAEMQATSIKQIEAVQRHQFSKLKIHRGVIVSRDDLFDDLTQRNKFRDSLPEMVGGEMEGQGIYEAIRETGAQVSFLILKGICDWGYKKNIDKKEKEENQKLAATNAAMLCAKTIASYELVETGSHQVDSDLGNYESGDRSAQGCATPASAQESPSDISLAGASAFLDNLSVPDIKIEVAFRDRRVTPDSQTIVYWPVRIRKPNVVHAAQTFIAAALQMRGLDVRLCFDDLGSPDGFVDIQSGVTELQDNVRKWAVKASNEETAELLVSKTRRFSEFVGNNTDRRPKDKALEILGDNLVRWLMESDKLGKVLRESKLMTAENSANLDGKPRKLLSPAVVWTVLQLLVKESACCSGIITLGGEDEKPIWRAFSSMPELAIANILLPKVQGDMDSEDLRPGSKLALERAMETQPELKIWFTRYAWHLPQLLANQITASLKEKQSVSPEDASQQIWELLL